MDELKVAVLRHYASPYYDPEKAHEYYMRTRELKGRSTTSLNDEGKKIRRSEIRRLRNFVKKQKQRRNRYLLV